MTLAVTLLLVEDEALLIDLFEDGLTESGFGVLKAQNGTAALKEIEEDAGRFRAIVTDIRLGSGPTGWDIAQRARELVPHMPIVYMSGDSTHEWASRGVPGSIILAKPFAAAQLVTAVSTLVNEADQHPAPPTSESGDAQ